MDRDQTLPPNATYRISVLMLEDSPLDCELAVARLERAGFTVDLRHAAGKDDFVKGLEEKSYDLILADYDVPGFNGMLALDMVRARDPQAPFIFISGVVGEEVAIDSLHRGATDYVLKQRLDRLGPAVRRALKESLEHKTRLRAEALARTNEERFRQLTNALPQLVWTMDDGGQLTYANPAWRQTMQPREHQWRPDRVLHQDELRAYQDAWSAARQSGAGFSLEARMWHSGQNEHHWHLIRIAPFASESELPQWLCTATDMQEQRERDEALRTAEKLAVTGRMAATIAHEINNPLESLTNLVYLLKQDEAISPASRGYVDMADYELQRVSAIARQTLAFYRDTSAPSLFDAGDLIPEVMELFAPRFRAKAITTEVSTAEKCVVFATRGNLRQVLINLISNAIDAVPHRGFVRVSIPQSAEADCRNKILIEDSGVGIAPEHAERLFTPFFSTKGEHGTGLGLWVSKGIVEKLGGTISLSRQSQPGGSNLTVVAINLPPAAESQKASASDRQLELSA